MKDGDLRFWFRKKFPSWHWNSVESAGTVSGIPDSEFCTTIGVQGWIEFKQTRIFHVAIRPLQVAWLSKRCRYGGNAWIAIRRMPLRSEIDELWLMRGDQAPALQEGGLENTYADMWRGGPSNWNWEEIQQKLCLQSRIDYAIIPQSNREEEHVGISTEGS